VVGQCHPANFDVVLRRNENIGYLGQESIPPAIFRHVAVEEDLVFVTHDPCGLEACRPERSVVAILNVKPGSPIIESRIGLPARELDPFPCVEASAAGGREHAEVTIRKIVYTRLRGQCIHLPRCGCQARAYQAQAGSSIRVGPLDGRVSRNLFQKQQIDALNTGLVLEPMDHDMAASWPSSRRVEVKSTAS
jgi:hypothetical protein